ncbi:hypothetical protein ABQF34_06970 [Mycolicibacterium boenickei]
MTRNSNGRPTTWQHGRWWVVGIVAAVAVCLITGAILVTGRSTSDSAPTFHRGDWQPLQQVVLASPMRERPIPGWRTPVMDLGLPELSIFAKSDEHDNSSTPFVGSLANHGYFLASSPDAPDRQQWLVGLDVDTGERLFPPVKIDSGPNFLKCFLNGPEFVLCLADDVHDGNAQGTAWVIDAESGNVVFNGPTELHTTPGSSAAVQQVGIYAVAEIPDRGLYGVGPRAEMTWFVPDTTKVEPTRWTADAAPPMLATAQDSITGSDHMVVFSLVDGKVVTPRLGDKQRPMTAVVYPEGFAVEVVADIKSSIPESLVFLDNAGKRLGETTISGSLSVLSMLLPMVESSPSYTIFGANGAGLVQLPGEGLGPDAVLIGHRLYAPESTWEGPVKVRRWRQFDLTTGKETETCQSNMSHYLANDGSVGVFETDRNEVTGATTFAMDLTTCEKLWTTPVNPDSFHRLWRIGNTLVELSDDGKELHSLVAPG